MPKSFASLAHTSFASKLRISVLESLCLAQRVGTLKQLLVSTVFFDRLGQWRDWYQSCFCLQISAAVGEAACLAISPGKIFSDLLRASSPPGKPPEVAHQIAAKQLQRCIYGQLLKYEGGRLHDCASRIRHKLRRWHLDVLPGVQAERLRRRLLLLGELVAPRVVAACFRTAWNGWATAARFQASAPCVLGCSPSAEDRIEHYCRCPRVRDLMINFLGLPEECCCIESFIFAATPLDPNTLSLMAVAVYSVFRATHELRNNLLHHGQEVVSDCLRQFCFSATNGHPMSAQRLQYATGRQRNASRGGRRSATQAPNADATTIFVQGFDPWIGAALSR